MNSSSQKERDLYSNDFLADGKPFYQPKKSLFKKMESYYKNSVEKISDKIYKFIDRNFEKIEKAERIIKPALFAGYVSIASLDYLVTGLSINSPSQEGTGFIRNLMENYSIRDGLLLTSLLDASLLGITERVGDMTEKKAVCGREIQRMPLLKDSLFYAYTIGVGIGHIKGLSSYFDIIDSQFFMDVFKFFS